MASSNSVPKLRDKEVRYYTAAEEHDDHVIAQASSVLDEDGLVYARRSGESEM